MLKPTTIYVLIDPRDGDVRYIGKTVQRVSERVSDHCAKARMGARKTYVHSWIRSLLNSGHKPAFNVLAVVPPTGDWRLVEKFWIAAFRAHGARLTNVTPGGDTGPIGYRHSAETRKRMSEWQIGRKMSLQARQKIGECKRGKPLSSEHKAKISKSLNGYKRSLEVRRNMSNAQRGRTFSPEHRAKLSAAHLGKATWNKGLDLSPEHRKNLSLSHIGLSSTNKGKKFTEAHRAALCEAWKRRKGCMMEAA